MMYEISLFLLDFVHLLPLLLFLQRNANCVTKIKEKGEGDASLVSTVR